MGRRTADGRGYDVVKAKVPKRDRAGNDISSEQDGRGRASQGGWYLSALAYGFGLIEDPGDSCTKDTEERLPAEVEESQQRQQVTMTIVCLAIYRYISKTGQSEDNEYLH